VHLALADPEAVPAGIYARQALTRLGLWDRLKDKVAAAQDVRQALVFVETGAAEAGIVYATDAAASAKVRVAMGIDPGLTEPIRYPLVLLKSAESNPAARAFYEFLGSAEAAGVFRKHGFVWLGDSLPRSDPNASSGPSWFFFSFLTAEEWSALHLSLLVALCAATAIVPLAVAIGHLLARRSFPGKWLLEAVVNLPLVVPPVVTGYLLLLALAPDGPVGWPLGAWLGVKIVFTWVAAVIAAAVVSFPLSVRAVSLAFQGVDPRLEMAARSLGAGRWATFFTVTLPLARRGVIAGWVLGFARSLGEFGATIMVAGNIAGQTRTIPLAIYSLAERPGGIERSWRLVALSILLACGALVASELLERRRRPHESA